jgi:hypothetical protein
MTAIVIIEYLSDRDGDVLCNTSDSFVVHVQDMKITTTKVIDALLHFDVNISC